MLRKRRRRYLLLLASAPNIGLDKSTFTTPDWQSGPYPNAIAQLAAAKAGLGLARIPCFLGDPEPTLKRVPPGQSAPCHDVWILTHKDLISTVRIQTFMDCMSKAFQQKQDLLEGRCPATSG